MKTSRHTDETDFLQSSILTTVREHKMFVPGGVVVVAVSGGPDSTALLHAIHALAPSLDTGLTAAHFEHGIRGEESLQDAEFVRRLCRDLDIPLQVEHADIPALAAEHGVSIQEAAREERHRFFRSVAASVSAPCEPRIAIAHTSDDRVETVLLNILRGTGVDGLAAMPPVSLPIVRPMLYVSREDASAYCRAHGLEPRIDSSNKKLNYTRNRLREELLPHLEAYYNSGIKAAILRLADVAAEDNAALNGLAERLAAEAVVSETPNEMTLNPAILRSSPVAISRRAVRAAIRRFRGDLNDIDLGAVDAIVGGCTRNGRVTRTLPMGGGVEMRVVCSASEIVLRRIGIDAPPLRWAIELAVPGSAVLPEGGLVVCAERLSVCSAHGKLADNVVHAYLFPAQTAGAKLVLRTWCAGDRMRPKGLSGTKKLQDLYTDHKVRSADRGAYPVLTTEERVLAVIGLRADEASLSPDEISALCKSSPEAQVVRVSVHEAAE